MVGRATVNRERAPVSEYRRGAGGDNAQRRIRVGRSRSRYSRRLARGHGYPFARFPRQRPTAARWAEELGLDGVFVPDHILDDVEKGIATIRQRARALGVDYLTFDMPKLDVPGMVRTMERFVKDVKTAAA